ncbi:MAG TPA: 2-hydroxychromene-2-carboxylate isomerase [Burkholderiales bacterium]|jgi:2-hydroxychromene-2-carboxylate isomerase|nr:2-hydroxychromene-2-carboxylate isomerase [Burkholderiales bacterium]
MRATWYFDFISPFAWIGLHRLKELPALGIDYRPVLFAGILKHWGQKGPAEMPTKRRYTYRWSHWWAHRQGIPLRYPAGHPFNPLHHLRLAIACGCRPDAIRKIFESVWTSGADATDAARFSALLGELNVKAEELEKPEIKDKLKSNTEEAIRHGVFGVPMLEIDGELFWGADSMDFAKAFLADRSVIRNPEMQRLDALPVAAARKS